MIVTELLVNHCCIVHCENYSCHVAKILKDQFHFYLYRSYTVIQVEPGRFKTIAKVLKVLYDFQDCKHVLYIMIVDLQHCGITFKRFGDR